MEISSPSFVCKGCYTESLCHSLIRTLFLFPSLNDFHHHKAFDRVEHQTLINDLSNIGVRGSALKWFINYLTDRQQQVRCGNTVSAPTSCSRGVPQGSVLGPLLFLLYTRKVPEVLFATKTIKSVLFADDILIYLQWKDTDYCRGLSAWSRNPPENLASWKWSSPLKQDKSNAPTT